MQFISRDLDVFQAEFDFGLGLKDLSHNFEQVVLPDIRDFEVNEVEYLRWVMVAIDDKRPIGYCYFRHHIQSRRSYIGHLYVDVSYRGLGVAAKLLNMTLDFIFGLLPNEISVLFTSLDYKESKESKLVELFLKRAIEQIYLDSDLRIKGTAYSQYLSELVSKKLAQNRMSSTLL